MQKVVPLLLIGEDTPRKASKRTTEDEEPSRNKKLKSEPSNSSQKVSFPSSPTPNPDSGQKFERRTPPVFDTRPSQLSSSSSSFQPSSASPNASKTAPKKPLFTPSFGKFDSSEEENYFISERKHTPQQENKRRHTDFGKGIVRGDVGSEGDFGAFDFEGEKESEKKTNQSFSKTEIKCFPNFSPSTPSTPSHPTPPNTPSTPSQPPSVPSPALVSPVSPYKVKPKKRKNNYANLFWFLLVTLVLVSAVLVFWPELKSLRRNFLPFCDSGKIGERDDCRKCPHFGICRDGKMECISGYKRVGGECLEDESLSLLSQRLVLFCSRYLSRVKAEKECGMRDTSFVDLSTLQKQAKALNLHRTEEEFALLWQRTFSKMASDRQNLEFQGSSISFNHLQLSQMPLSCRVRREMEKWKLQLTVSIIFLSFLFAVSYVRNRNNSRYEMIEKILSDSLHLLKSKKAQLVEGKESKGWMTVEELRDVVCPKRFLHLWPIVVEKLADSPKVNDSFVNVEGEQSRTLEWRN